MIYHIWQLFSLTPNLYCQQFKFFSTTKYMPWIWDHRSIILDIERILELLIRLCFELLEKILELFMR
jgi:hypothetical protein